MGGERGRPAHYQDLEVVRSYHSRYSGGLKRWKHERKAAILRAWIEEARPSRVLEVACGPGRFHSAYRDRPAVASDLSLEMLRRFRAACPSATLLSCDASALPFPPGSFDLVFATRFLSHLRGGYRSRVLSEMVRVSRDRVILDGRHRYNLRFLSRWIRRSLGLAHAHKLRHTYGQFRDELGRAGLEVCRIRSIAWGLSARFLILARKGPAPALPPGSSPVGAGE